MPPHHLRMPHILWKRSIDYISVEAAGDWVERKNLRTFLFSIILQSDEGYDAQMSLQMISQMSLQIVWVNQTLVFCKITKRI